MPPTSCAATGDRAWQYFNVLAIVAECDRLAVQWACVLSPQCVASGISRSAVARTERTAVWRVAACAAAPLVIVRAQDVDGG